tara:strand:+ start:897 stop:1157 length:261 start_codon:yes stop_codon:yes gene_type:complete
MKKKIMNLIFVSIIFFIICKCFQLIETHGNYRLSGEQITGSRINSWACLGPSNSCHQHSSWERYINNQTERGTHNINDTDGLPSPR